MGRKERFVPGYNEEYIICIDTKEGKCISNKKGKRQVLSNKPSGSDKRIYWNLSLNGKMAHQQAAVWIALTYPELVQNEWFEGAVIDHINTDPLDNRPENLRWCTQKENANNPLTLLHKSEANKGKKLTEETRKRLSESHRGKRPWMINRVDLSKPVEQYTLDNEFVAWYPSTMEAERQTGIRHTNIGYCCNKKRHSAGGYIWIYSNL